MRVSSAHRNPDPDELSPRIKTGDCFDTTQKGEGKGPPPPPRSPTPPCNEALHGDKLCTYTVISRIYSVIECILLNPQESVNSQND